MLFEPAGAAQPPCPGKRVIRSVIAVLILAGLSFSVFAQSSVTFAWDPSPSQVDGYRIYQGIAPGTYSQAIECGSATNKTVSGLVAGTTYYFAVVAYDSLGLESDFSNEVQYSSSAQSGVTFAWDPSPSQVDGYRIYQGTAPGTYSQAIECGNVTSKTVAGLVAGTTYYFAVVAYDSLGLESDFSNEVQYTPAVQGTPVIVLTSPTDGASYTAPVSIGLAASITPNGQTITKVQFINGTSLLGEDTSAPYGFTWNDVPTGTYALKARALYGTSGSVDSQSATVTVTSAPLVGDLTFAASSGAIAAPFVISGDMIYQPIATGLATGGRAVYNFSIKKNGDYIIKADVLAPSGSQNSFYINIDAEPTDPQMIWDIPPSSILTNRTVCWRGTGAEESNYDNPQVFRLSSGSHQLIVRGREANTQLGTIEIVAAPRLNMRRNKENVVLSWTTAETNLTLQTTTNLFDPDSWVTLPDPPSVIEDYNYLTNSTKDLQRFYRLVR